MSIAFVALIAIGGDATGSANGAQPRPRNCDRHHWIGAWSAPTTDASESFSPQLGDVNERTMLNPTIGGSRVRLRISNRFAGAPLVLDHATIALAGEGANLKPGTLRTVRFAGARGVTVPAGGEIFSDPVAIDFRALQRLAISLDVDAASTAPVAQHFTAQQTTYLSPSGQGDLTSSTSGSAYTTTSLSRFIVSGIDVWAGPSRSSLVAFGDSLTDGLQAAGETFGTNPGVDANARYTDFLARRLGRGGRQRLAVLNAGISGNALTTASFPPFGLPARTRFGRDVLQQSGVGNAIVLEGTNDLGLRKTAHPIIRELRMLTERLRRHRIQAFLGTLPPLRGSTGTEAEQNHRARLRRDVNDWIRHQDLSAGVIEFGRALADPDSPQRLLPKFDSGDHLHPSTAGYRRMAQAVPLRALRTRCG